MGDTNSQKRGLREKKNCIVIVDMGVVEREATLNEMVLVEGQMGRGEL